MSVYYKVDSRKRTYAEHWRIQWPNLEAFLVAAFCKLLGIRQRHTFGMRRPESLDLHEPSAVPRLVRDRLADIIRECDDLDLPFQFYSSVDVMIGSRVKAYTAAMLHPQGLCWATAIAVLVRGKNGEEVRPVRFNCFSRLPDDRYVVTSAHEWRITPHPDDLLEHLVGAWPDAVVARHLVRIEEPALRPLAVRQGELDQVILTREQRHVDYQVERGVFVPMTPEEVERATGRR
jgi:hypothetical protein